MEMEALDAVELLRSRTTVLVATVETLDAVDTVRSRSVSRMLRSAIGVSGAGWEPDVVLFLTPRSAGDGAGGAAGAAACVTTLILLRSETSMNVASTREPPTGVLAPDASDSLE